MDGLLEKIDERAEEEMCAVTNQFCSQTDDVYNNNNSSLTSCPSATKTGGRRHSRRYSRGGKSSIVLSPAKITSQYQTRVNPMYSQ